MASPRGDGLGEKVDWSLSSQRTEGKRAGGGEEGIVSKTLPLFTVAVSKQNTLLFSESPSIAGLEALRGSEEDGHSL